MSIKNVWDATYVSVPKTAVLRGSKHKEVKHVWTCKSLGLTRLCTVCSLGWGRGDLE